MSGSSIDSDMELNSVTSNASVQRQSKTVDVRDVIDKDYFIPAYQRGYRWEKEQVNRLIDDLYNFAEMENTEGKSDDFYCLQSLVIKRNAETLRVKDADIVMSDAVMFLKETDKKFDLIFVDPPYALEVYDDVVNIVLEKELLKPNGALILESERELNLPKDKFKEIRFYKYGLAKIYLIRNY